MPVKRLWGVVYTDGKMLPPRRTTTESRSDAGDAAATREDALVDRPRKIGCPGRREIGCSFEILCQHEVCFISIFLNIKNPPPVRGNGESGSKQLCGFF